MVVVVVVVVVAAVDASGGQGNLDLGSLWAINTVHCFSANRLIEAHIGPR